VVAAAGQNVRDVSGSKHSKSPITNGPELSPPGFGRGWRPSEFHDCCNHGDPAVDPAIQYASLDGHAAFEAGADRIGDTAKTSSSDVEHTGVIELRPCITTIPPSVKDKS
jgi:hypothetical protein